MRNEISINRVTEQKKNAIEKKFCLPGYEGDFDVEVVYYSEQKRGMVKILCKKGELDSPYKVIVWVDGLSSEGDFFDGVVSRLNDEGYVKNLLEKIWRVDLSGWPEFE